MQVICDLVCILTAKPAATVPVRRHEMEAHQVGLAGMVQHAVQLKSAC